MLDYLPTDILTNIFSRLPSKTLIKCTTLSKPFLSLISSNHFISAHISQNKTTNLLLRYFNNNTKEEKYHFEADDDNFCGFQSEEGLVLPFHDFVGDRSNVVGCVNGVLCLVYDSSCEGARIILWNPSIRKYVHVPEPGYVFDSCGVYESVCGFGFDSVLNDYKVVRIVDIYSENEGKEVEVYSLTSGCWRFVGVGPAYSIKRNSGYIPCFLHGSIYWWGSHWEGSKYDYVILKFDVSKESFETIEMPCTLKDSRSKHVPINVQDCHGMLALISRIIECDNDITTSTCSVWVMKESGVVKSWTKIIDFNNVSMTPWQVSYSLMPKALGFRKNGKVIMVKRKGTSSKVDAIVLIDLITRTETFLREVAADCCSFYMSTYVESMALFKEGKGINDLTPELMKKTREVEVDSK